MPRVFVSAILSAGLLLAAAGALPAQAAESLPNLVIIFADDMGYGDLGAYGHPTIRTPRMDRAAVEGMRFTQFYVGSPVCSPSRAALLTGRYPVRTGITQGLIPGRVLFPGSEQGLPPEEVTIAEVLREAGYATAAIGKWHLGDHAPYLPTQQGFDLFYGLPYSNDMDWVDGVEGTEGYWDLPLYRNRNVIEQPADQTLLTRRYTEEAVRFIRANRDGPFFVYLAHSMPHIPLFTSPEFAGVSSRGLYGDVIEELDWSVGRVLDALEEEGLAENTLVIFT
ncbi:MAG: sulfatase-like hydrolase/transferase, partial [Longimicrobiales bacterium]|nr:sulfatase-like hydrolase/transferase [Longimicrobiales bacterium]